MAQWDGLEFGFKSRFFETQLQDRYGGATDWFTLPSWVTWRQPD